MERLNLSRLPAGAELIEAILYAYFTVEGEHSLISSSLLVILTVSNFFCPPREHVCKSLQQNYYPTNSNSAIMVYLGIF
jgi:hypothetical protein